jgi:hypothetical protein
VYAETLRDQLLLEITALLAPDAAPYAAPLDALAKALARLLAGPALHPADPANALLTLERAFADGLAELEQAGHATAGLSLFEYLHKLDYLSRKQAARAEAQSAGN